MLSGTEWLWGCGSQEPDQKKPLFVKRKNGWSLLSSDKTLPVVFLELTWNPVSKGEESESSPESTSI